MLNDAKPKMPKDAPWEDFDWEFAEKCVEEFGTVDAKGFTFRYHGHGGEHAHVSFERLQVAMDHTYQVLEGVLTVLVETRGEMQDWLDEQASW